MKGKIIKGIGGFYYVHDGIGTIYECRAKGIFRNRKIKPLVGDDVEFSELDDVDLNVEGKKFGSIEEILPRKNELIRPASANVDQAVIIFAAAAPEPNLNLLDRFLIMMEEKGLPVIIIFNKKDLVTEDKICELRSIYEKTGYPLYFVSLKDKEDVSAVLGLMRGKTTVLAGPSGVGKSTFTNTLVSDACMETGTVSEKIQRGKHTTRHSELFFVEKDTYLMDTPGFSSLTPDSMEANEVKDYYPEFDEFVDECRFLGCVHIGERDCGVKDAVKDGKLSPVRYENYRLIYTELKERKRY